MPITYVVGVGFIAFCVQRFSTCCHFRVQEPLNQVPMSLLSASKGLSAWMVNGCLSRKPTMNFVGLMHQRASRRSISLGQRKVPFPHSNRSTRLPGVGMLKSLLGAPRLTLGSCQASSARGSLPLCPLLSTFLLLSAHCAGFPMKLSFQSLKWPPLNL